MVTAPHARPNSETGAGVTPGGKVTGGHPIPLPVTRSLIALLAAQRVRGHFQFMLSDFTVFSMRLDEACRSRGITAGQLLASFKFGGRRRVGIYNVGARALDLYEIAAIADRLNVSIAFLLGRTDAMELPAALGEKV